MFLSKTQLLLVVLLPLAGSLLAGLFGRKICRVGAHSVTILGPDGRAPEQLEIYILTANSRLTAEYTAGNYRIEGIPPGKQTLRIQGKGVVNSISLKEGEEAFRKSARLVLTVLPRRDRDWSSSYDDGVLRQPDES